MLIYSTVKKIFRSKGIKVKIIQPQTHEIEVDVKHHKSKWNDNEFSNLNSNDFSLQEIKFINQLISENKWIEEESLDLIKLLKTIISFKPIISFCYSKSSFSPYY